MKKALYILSIVLLGSTSSLLQAQSLTVKQTQNCETGQIELKATTDGVFTGWSTLDGQDMTIDSPNSSSTLVKPTRKQTYIASANIPDNNLITNSDFEAGSAGFTTDYTLKSPTGGYYIGSNITFDVDASDDASIAQVEFFDGNTSLSVDNTAPYSYTWTSVQEGIYFVRAVATDNEGLTTSTELLPVLVGNGSDSTSVATMTKRGSGSSEQSIDLGDPIEDFYYEWTNAASVEVFGVPAGLTVDIDNTNQEVSFTGTPTAAGVYVYSVMTTGGDPDTYKSGIITVTGAGNQAPSTEFSWPYDGSDFNVGDYAIVTNPQEFSSSFVPKKDHSGLDGYLFIADGSNDNTKVVYSTTVNVTAGATYVFDAWVSNIHEEFIEATTPGINTPELLIGINGTTLYTGEIPRDTAWHQIHETWTASTSGNAVITIHNLNESLNENDFALDDITLYTLIAAQETITVSPCTTNIFSPNGDGQLDDFFIEGPGTAKIYSPAGTLVNEMALPAYWDGTDRDGRLVNPGMYAVIINENDYIQVTVVR